ncbi:hypothetical protein IKS57_00190, partial [bacterium]|nr:hypothetical protein [bacterium]
IESMAKNTKLINVIVLESAESAHSSASFEPSATNIDVLNLSKLDLRLLFAISFISPIRFFLSSHARNFLMV